MRSAADDVVAVARRWWRPWYRAVLVGLIVAICAAIHIEMPGKYPDFTVFWAAATHFGGPVYDSAFLTPLQHGPPGDRPFAYPPTFLLLILPLGLLPMQVAYVAWVTASAIALVEVGARLTRFSWFALTSPIAMFAGLIGQTIFIVGALVAGAFAIEGSIAAGILLGVAASIKPQVAILIPVVLLLEKRWTVLLAMGGTGLLLCAAATVVFGPPVWVDWLAQLPRFMQINDRLNIPRLGLPLPFNLLAAMASVGLMALATAEGDRPKALVAALAGGLLLSPHSPAYDATVVFVPAIAAVGLGWRLVPLVLLLFGEAWLFNETWLAPATFAIATGAIALPRLSTLRGGQRAPAVTR
ncbi:MAG: glycosyltransferase family 87 protein [Sphingomicrobium sp.]